MSDGKTPIMECLTMSRMVADGAERVVLLANSAERALMPARPQKPAQPKGSGRTLTLGQLATPKKGGVS